jgi:DnaJ-class molecular chaperone
MKCPDCDSVNLTPYTDQGDGRCSECHGTGAGGVIEDLIDGLNPLSNQESECQKCHGTGQCQTCGGSGIV